MANIPRYALLAGLVILILAGAIAGVRQLTNGLAVTNLHEPAVWGLYVVCFVFFMGIGAGALFVASLAMCTSRQEYQPLARTASVVSLVCLMLAGIFITIDLGRPDRAFLLMLKPQFTSPLIWDFLILNAMLAVTAIYTLFVVRREILGSGGRGGLLASLLTIGAKDGEEKTTPLPMRILAGVMVVAVVILYVLTTRVFASLRARPDWNTTGLGPIFLVSAIVSGLAAICVVAGLWRGEQQQDDSANRPWRVVRIALIILIVADIILTVSPVVSMRQFNSSPEGIWSQIGGAAALEIVVGMLVPLIILVMARRRLQLWSALAGLLILFGVFVKRWHIITPAMLRRSLPLPTSSYHPGAVEYAVSGGIAAFGVLMILVLAWLIHLAGRRQNTQALVRGRSCK